MRNIRISIVTVTAILICVGVVMIFSSSSVYALQVLGNGSYFLTRHFLFLIVGLALTIFIMTLDYREVQNFAKPLLLVAIALLILVLIPGLGKESYGARRWFKLWIFSFQPSEFAKIAVLLYVSDFLSRKQNKIRDFTEGFLQTPTAES